jgi:hypothetical protein
MQHKLTQRITFHLRYILRIFFCTGCPSTYQTRQFFNDNFTTTLLTVQQLAALQTHSSSFLTLERNPVQILLQYLHWF